MEKKLISLPYADIQMVNGCYAEVKEAGAYLTFDGKNYHVSNYSRNETSDNLFLFSDVILKNENVIDSETLTEKDNIYTLEENLKSKQLIIDKLEDKINKLSFINKELDVRAKEALKNCEELKTPKRNGCSEWVSAKTLISLVELLTDKK